MIIGRRSLIAWVASFVIMVGTAHAQDSARVRWYEAIDVKGLVMSSVGFNFNEPTSRTNRLRVFDVDNQALVIDLVNLSLRHNASLGRAGFRLDLDAGPRIPEITHAVGLEMGKIDLRQAYISYIAPVGAGLTIDAGKFVTPCGYEVIEGPDALNDNATHSFMFGYAIPFTHTGVRLTYPLDSTLSIMAMAVNGWDNVIDNNESPSAGAQVVWKPSGATSVSLSGIIGPEVSKDDLTRSLIDLAASTEVAAFLTLGVGADYGRERTSAIIRDSSRLDVIEYAHVEWRGIAGYATLHASKDLAFALRGELFEDPNGVRTGARQTLREFTLTPILLIAPDCTLKLDLRHDRSSAHVFDASTEQATVRAYLYYSF